MRDYSLDNRRYVIAGVAVLIVVVYIIRLFMLQITSDDYKKSADSNAFLKKIEYPARGGIYDRNGKLLVFNQPAYDIMVVMNEAKDHLDTLDLCAALNISREEFDRRMANIKDRGKNPGYQKRSIRQYRHPYAAHILGDVGEVNPDDLSEDQYYQSGDYIGKLGIERSYEKQLRGVKGMQILLRDAHGRVQGHYQNGKFDQRAQAGKNLTLGIDVELQKLGERLMEGKIGSIVAIEPSTGEVLCMVSSPSYDPRMMVGRQRSKSHHMLSQNVWKPLLNRSIMGQYPPGSTFKTTQGLAFLSEGIIHPTQTAYPCGHGFNYKGLHVGCHGHASPLSLVPALSTSCNGYFCWGLYYMIGAKAKYGSVQNAMNKWRDYMVSMGFGYKLGIDLPGEKRGLIPNAQFYDKAYKGSWNGLTIISIAIGQGEVNATPLQIANLGATIANRGWFITPHVVKKVQGEPLDTAFTQRRYSMAKRDAYDYVVKGMRASATGGTCHELAKYDFVACGKTGTAQNRGHDHSVFMGFAPMDNPKIAVAVYVENGGWGATYGVPIGGLIMEQYINGHLSEASMKRAEEFQNRHIAYGSTSR